MEESNLDYHMSGHHCLSAIEVVRTQFENIERAGIESGHHCLSAIEVVRTNPWGPKSNAFMQGHHCLSAIEVVRTRTETLPHHVD